MAAPFSRHPRAAAAVAGLLGLLVCACGGQDDPLSAELAPVDEACRPLPQPAAEVSGLVLIVGDTLRRDWMGIHGGPARTPAYDAFARSGVWFDRATTQAPWTKPAVATLFTSTYPSQHGVVSHPAINKEDGPGTVTRSDILSPEFTTLAEAIGAGGIRTGAIVANPWLRTGFGFAQGFADFDDRLAAEWKWTGLELSRSALRWLEEVDGRFFLYLHYLGGHQPYGSLTPDEVAALEQRRALEPPLSERARSMIPQLVTLEDGRTLAEAGIAPSLALLERAYAKAVERFDTALGVFLDGLAASGRAAETAVIVTSDHGESLFDRGFGNHGLSLFEDELGVPLAMRLPGAAAKPRAVPCPVGLVDLMPTICAILDVACPARVFGRPLVAPAGSSAPARAWVVSEGVARRPTNRAVATRRYKLLREPYSDLDGNLPENPFSLYDLLADPEERSDLLDGEVGPVNEKIAWRLHEILTSAVEPMERPSGATVEIDPETAAHLKALGYLAPE